VASYGILQGDNDSELFEEKRTVRVLMALHFA
jgi:hypothetical protein